LAALQTDSGDLLLKIKSINVDDKQISALRTKVKSLQKEIHVIQSKVVLKDRLPEVINHLRKRGGEHQLEFISIIPDYESLMSSHPDAAPDKPLRLTIHLKLQGYYHNFGRFVESLHTLPFYLSIGEMMIEYSRKIHPQLEIIMDAEVFLRES
jgi:Tfp pilus assembly protein PilO